MSQRSAECVTELLTRWRGGDPEALQALVPLVYKELRQLAHYCLQEERSHHTLQSTDLVHEAYLRLTKQGPAHFEHRTYFFAVSAHLMRQILVDYARARRAAKRDGGCKLTLDEALGVPDRNLDLVALDEVLKDLAACHLFTRKADAIKGSHFPDLPPTPQEDMGRLPFLFMGRD